MSSVFCGTAGGVRGVTIDAVKTLEFTKTPVYDDRNNYVFTACRLVVQGVLSRSLNAYQLGPGQVDRDPRSRPGVNIPGASTDVAIRHWLAAPRRRIIYRVGSVTLLDSHMDGRTCDVAGGPVCLESPTVIEVIGSPTLHVRAGWLVRIRENQSSVVGANSVLGVQGAIRDASPLISHTYDQTEIIDVDGYSRIVTRGRAKFRVDRLVELGATPDAFREWLVVPVHNNSRRDSVNVVASASGDELMYEIVDKEVYMRIVSREISRVEGTHTVTVVKPSKESQWVAAAATAQSLLTSVFSRSVPSGLAGTVYSYVNGITPTIEHRIVVRCWGHSHVDQFFIGVAAQRVLASRLTAIPDLSRAGHSVVSQMSRDITGSFVEVSAVIERGAFSRSFAHFEAGDAAVADMNDYFPGMGVTETTRVLSWANGAGKSLPGGNGTRGNYIGTVAAQALLAQDEIANHPEYGSRPDRRFP